MFRLEDNNSNESDYYDPEDESVKENVRKVRAAEIGENSDGKTGNNEEAIKRY